MGGVEGKGSGGTAAGLVPTVQEALACCERGRLMRALLVDGPSQGEEGPEERARRERLMRENLSDALDGMLSLPVDRDAGRGRVVLPAERYVALEEEDRIERRVEARLLLVGDVEAARRVAQAPCAVEEAREGLPLRTCRLDPWGLTLASRVWLEGAGGVRERYRVLAAVVRDMTFCGFDAPSVAHEQARLVQERDSMAASAGVPWPPSDVRAHRRRVELGLERPGSVASRALALNLCAEADLARRLIQALERLGEESTCAAHA